MEVDSNKSAHSSIVISQDNDSCVLINTKEAKNDDRVNNEELSRQQRNFLGPSSNSQFEFEKKYIYPAPKTKGKVMYVCKSPNDDNCYYTLTEEGYICCYNVQGANSLLDQMIHYTDIKVNIKASIINFVRMVRIK